MKKTYLMLIGILAIALVGYDVRTSVAQPPRPLKTTVIFDIGGIGDGGFNDSAYRGMEKAVAEFGVTAHYVEPSGALERDTALQTAAASNAEMIIGVGFIFSEKMTELAGQFSNKKFVCVDYTARYDNQGRTRRIPDNLAGLVFREEEGSYLVGAMAALKSRTGTIGFLGGMNSPIIRRFQAGYLAGARAVRPDIRVLSEYTGLTGKAFVNPQKGYALADRMYSQGADIIYHAAGVTGSGLFQAAQKRHRLAIGVDINQSAQAPGWVLTSMTKHVDVAVYETVKGCTSGSFTGGIRSFGLKENGVGFVYDDQNRDLVTESIYQRIAALQNKIVSGALTVPSEAPHTPLISRNDLREVLNQLKEEAADALEKLDSDLKVNAKMLTGIPLDSDRARSVLQRIHGLNPCLINCATVSDRGILLAVEPEPFRKYEGDDISARSQWMNLVAGVKPVFGGYFHSDLGMGTVVMQYPILSAKGRFTGAISALLEPVKLLTSIMEPVSTNLPVDIFLMQTDGMMIYDVDANQIGRNVFQDPLYQPFPDLLRLARKMADTRKGTGTYRFYRDGTGEPVEKLAYWKTIHKHGAEWRIVITCAQDRIAK